ncbi:uncharacterized protein si:dkey-91i10.2 [Callorhinchus milii]|uniref:uncharacterized protein si:dkey-91i10.2 n=1 Tax=Callorhinchus milii TaxID=7868 RepID=UPI001C3FDA8B|nr:uncharacterized protein si:dkey-91i10.2 [Callorhinchus milii]
MPDVKAVPCDFPATGPSSLCGMDIGRCPDDHPPSPFPALSSPSPCLSGQGHLTHVGQVRRSQGSERWETTEGSPQELGARLHRSLENLHWAATSQVCGPPHIRPGNQAQYQTPLEEARNPGPPLIALRVPTPWFFTPVDETGNAKRGLKEKLRLQSSKAAEPNKPLRPHALLVEATPGERAWAQDPPSGPAAWPGSSRRLVSPEEIKREALRRLTLQRQNSTPNLALGWNQEAGEDHVGGFRRDESAEPRCWEPGADRRRHSKARAYIPSFEEFKRMRQRENREVSSGEAQGFGQTGLIEGMVNSGSCPTLSLTEPHLPGRRASTDSKDVFRSCLAPRRGDSELRLPRRQPCPEAQAAPIRTCPAPGSPLHTLPRGGEDQAGEGSRTAPGSGLSLDPGSEGKQVCEAQSSCCPSLLLDAATDLSGYGAKLQQMKDGLIGSAIDLLKKSCAGEISAELPTAEISECQEPEDATLVPADGIQSRAPVSTGTWERGAGSGKKPKSTPVCRRSSSDAAYETPESAKAQRECRLRPHFSDPMPTDAVKRKQLEMKIAAAAWGLGHKRRPGESSGQAFGQSTIPPPHPPSRHLTHQLAAKHRWSNMSTDSGIVGLSDEREEREEEEEEEGVGVEEEDEGGRKSAEVERADSGIGPATAKKWKSRAGVGARARAWEGPRSAPGWAAHRPCVDCGEREPPEPEPRTGGRQRRRERLCGKCGRRRTERKEAVLEFVNTEGSYGEDLRVIRQEFYLPMQDAGLLAREQLAVIFSNIQELIEVNEKFTQRLHDSTEQALDQGDEDFLTVCIGEMFLEFVNMLPAFQTYCIHQSTSINMLNTLEKEKELLRIFLDVSQNDNTALRRMNLRSFLMAPLQRVTKYPLLLSRISSATLEYHPDHPSLREAKSRVESHLEHINMKTKQEGAPWCLRSFRRDSRRNREVIDIEMREMAVRAVGWAREETRFAMEGRLQFCQPSDGQWARKGNKALKFQSLHVILMIIPGQQEGAAPEEGAEEVRDAALVLIRDRSNGKFSLFRDPLHLGHCVVSSDPDCDDTFELLDIRRDAFVFRGAERPQTRHWFRLVRHYSRGLGSWKRRRNALPNIMINASQSRA